MTKKLRHVILIKDEFGTREIAKIQFGSNKANKRFEELLEQYGKVKQPKE